MRGRFRRLGLGLAVLGVTCSHAHGEGMHTFDGQRDIATIEVTAVYFVPSDRTPLPDWRERVDYFARRIVAFHRRELGSGSTLNVRVHPEPLRPEHDSAWFRTGDQNVTFFKTMDQARTLLKWPGKRPGGFPILLVLSDINWRELDDFRRERLVDGKPVHEGAVAPDGRHFPGAESGGARATYDAHAGLGLGLVSADGWRVPYSGSDCVVYHEGVGHAIGLPHPDPIDDSVMGTAQYQYWINQTRLNESQKEALGWRKDRDGGPEARDGLFSTFTAIPSPARPTAGGRVDLKLIWPSQARVRSLRVRYQTELTGPWKDVPVAGQDAPPATVTLGTFDAPTPVSYRVDATLEDGQSTEIWGYFQVH